MCKEKKRGGEEERLWRRFVRKGEVERFRDLRRLIKFESSLSGRHEPVKVAGAQRQSRAGVAPAEEKKQKTGTRHDESWACLFAVGEGKKKCP
jgi:hypothetical protein